MRKANERGFEDREMKREGEDKRREKRRRKEMNLKKNQPIYYGFIGFQRIMLKKGLCEMEYHI